MPPDTDISAFSVWLLGASLGLTACAATCMPYIGTWAFARGDDGRGEWRDALGFLAGRLTAYILLGALAGNLGAWFVRELASGMGNLAIGCSAIASAAWLAWPSRPHTTCQRLKRNDTLSPYLMGASLTLIPCAPLTTLLAASAAAGSARHGAFLGGVFGLGTLLTPMLVLIPACALFGHHLLRHQAWLRPWMSGGAIAVLLVLGHGRIDLVAGELFPYLAGIAVLLVGWAHLRRPANNFIRPIQIHPR